MSYCCRLATSFREVPTLSRYKDNCSRRCKSILCVPLIVSTCPTGVSCRNAAIPAAVTAETDEECVLTEELTEELDAMTMPASGQELEEHMDWFDQWYPVAFVEFCQALFALLASVRSKIVPIYPPTLHTLLLCLSSRCEYAINTYILRITHLSLVERNLWFVEWETLNPFALFTQRDLEGPQIRGLAGVPRLMPPPPGTQRPPTC
eukprot:1189668-Prorocentrum_minimum.AAC.1